MIENFLLIKDCVILNHPRSAIHINLYESEQTAD